MVERIYRSELKLLSREEGNVMATQRELHDTSFVICCKHLVVENNNLDYRWLTAEEVGDTGDPVSGRPPLAQALCMKCNTDDSPSVEGARIVCIACFFEFNDRNKARLED